MFGTRTGLKMSEAAANVRKRPSANLETIAGEHVRVGASASIMGASLLLLPELTT